jgi:DNA-directed RNA polymerase subunit E'/Rpb7
MFSLLTIEDKILLDPSQFADFIPDRKKKKKNKLEMNENDEINNYSDIVYLKLREKYISKIIVDQGLVVSIKNFKIKSDLIVEIEGVVDVRYECNLVIFCPKKGDILYGTICDSDQNYIIVDCEIIKVKVPIQQLMKPYYFNKKEKLWFWSYNGKNYYYEKNEKCRLKVLYTIFNGGKDFNKMINDKKMEANNEENNVAINEKDIINNLKREDIMEINCSMSQEGLGPIKWWE